MTQNSINNIADNLFVTSLSFDTGTNTISTFVDSTSFTPTLEFGGGTTGITYTGQNGTYSRIGNVVFYNINIVLSSKGSSTGAATITGLPITSVSFSSGATRWSQINLSANFTKLSAEVTSGLTRIALQENGDNVGVSTIQDTQFANNSVIHVTGNYFV